MVYSFASFKNLWEDSLCSSKGHTFTSLGSVTVVGGLILPGPSRTKIYQKQYQASTDCTRFLQLRFAKISNAYGSLSAGLSGSLYGANISGPSFICRGAGQKGTPQQSSPGEDSDSDQDPKKPTANDGIVDNGSSETALESDWRAFRARLVAGEQALSNSAFNMPDEQLESTSIAGISGKMWAHPLHVPEAGCVLVATDKLDGQVDFERTVILLLRVGSNRHREGPYGVILNRPTLQKINELRPTDRALSNVFGDCQYFYGGPLDSETFLCMQEGRTCEKFVEFIPGIHCIGVDGFKHAADLVKAGVLTPRDFRYYAGYAGWGLDQLQYEIASGYWCVAACSPTLLKATSDYHLWERVLLLMGGQYAALSKKPRRGGL